MFEGIWIVAPPGCTSVDFVLEPFAHGTFRQAHRGNLIFDRTSSPLQDPVQWLRSVFNSGLHSVMDANYDCVVKVMRNQTAYKSCEWEPELRVLSQADGLARAFNKEVRPATKISFANAMLFQMTQAYGTNFNKGERIVVEQMLPGRFVKVNSNNGWFDTIDWLVGYDSATAQAFSHWTWHHTGGECLVCDLQGVQQQGRWLFTDPGIHSKRPDGRLGFTDLGQQGMNAFFSTHKCNELCKHWNKPNVIVDVGLNIRPRRSSTWARANVKASTAVHLQNGGTCYAHAVSSVVRAAEGRIVGRKVESHDRLVQCIVAKHGWKGEFVERVLAEVCPPKRLSYAQVSASDAKKALQMGRAVVLSFTLTAEQWDGPGSFAEFFQQQAQGVLTQVPLAISGPKDGDGHAVVVVGFDFVSGRWRIKNSWGDNWSDGGYFHVSDSWISQIGAQFFDVFFYEHELSDADRRAYHNQLQSWSVGKGK